jgi:hypothetical protein
LNRSIREWPSSSATTVELTSFTSLVSIKELRGPAQVACPGERKMPSGLNLPLWKDSNPPQGDDAINQTGYFWNHPQMGPVMYDARKKNWETVTPEFLQKNLADPEPTAGEQVDALTVEDAPAAGAADLGGGVTIGETQRSHGRETHVQQAERKKAEAASAAVAAAANQSRAFNSGALGGVGIGNRGGMNIAAQELMQAAAAEGKVLSEEEALALVRAEEEASAGGQADALEGAGPPQ